MMPSALFWSGHTQNVIVILVYLCFMSHLSLRNVHAASLRSLSLRFTARDFMPSGCMRPGEIDQYWFGDSNAQKQNSRWINITARCPIGADILSGKFSGHPDFEPAPGVFAQGCSGSPAALVQDSSKPNYTLVSGGISCALLNQPTLAPSKNPTAPPGPAFFPALTKIVEAEMEFHADGLPKPVYCRNGPYARGDENGTRRCGWLFNNATNEFQVTTTGRAAFDAWYRDDQRYSKRVGFNLELQETLPESGIFTYTSNSFHPFNHVLPCNSTTDRRLDCSNGGRVWPRGVLGTTADPYDERNDTRGAFGFTTEMHSFFTLMGNETFEFRGDDDVWIFINERLALDVGGLHNPARSVINLGNPEVQRGLGLTVGGIYALDIFHAERKSVGSNFGLTTSLQQECNVMSSAKTDYPPPSNLQLESLWILSGAELLGSTIRLGTTGFTDHDRRNSASYAFLKHRMLNLGAGFIAKFAFRVAPEDSADGGFAFVLHRDSLENLNGGSGMNFGFKKNLPTALGVAFNMHQNRLELVVRDSVVVYAPLIHPNAVLTDGAWHEAEIRYYGSRPNWMEVYIDEDTFLQTRHLNLSTDVLQGESSAWVGFTAGSGNVIPPTVEVRDFEIRTVAIEPTNTQLANDTNPQGEANGKDPISFIVQTFDACGNPVSFGGFAQEVQAVLRKLPVKADFQLRRLRVESSAVLLSPPSNMSLFEGSISLAVESDTPQNLHLDVIEATVIDELNGRYRLEFVASSLDQVGVYELYAQFGNQPLSNGTLKAEFVSPSTRTTISPTIPFEPEIVDPLALFRYIGMGIGGMCAVGFCCVFVGLRARKRWRATKKFVKPGRTAVAEKDVVYQGDLELDLLQMKVMESAQRLQTERSRQNQLLDNEIEELREQIDQINCEIRRMKQHKQTQRSNEVICILPPPPANGPEKRKVEFNALQVV